jgi:hypothetical protein
MMPMLRTLASASAAATSIPLRRRRWRSNDGFSAYAKLCVAPDRKTVDYHR